MLVVHRFITIQHLPARNRIISHHLFHFYLTLFTYAHYLYFLPYLSFPVFHLTRNIRLNHLWLQVLIYPSFTLHCSLPQSERTLDQIPWQIHLLKQYRLVANTWKKKRAEKTVWRKKLYLCMRWSRVIESFPRLLWE